MKFDERNCVINIAVNKCMLQVQAFFRTVYSRYFILRPSDTSLIGDKACRVAFYLSRKQSNVCLLCIHSHYIQILICLHLEYFYFERFVFPVI